MTGVPLTVRLAPLDPLLFGDNRSTRAGEDHALADQDPSPATLYGAIGARIARCLGAEAPADWERRAAPVLGEFAADLGRNGGARAALEGYALLAPEGRAWFPRPLHLPVEEIGGRLFALAPLAPACAAGPPSSLRFPRLLAARSQGKHEPRAELENDLFVPAKLLAEALCGGAGLDGRSISSQVRRRESFFRAEVRAGLGMDNDSNTAAEGLLFSRPYRRFAGRIGQGAWRSAGYLAWYRVLGLGGCRPAVDWSGVGFLGGDRRRVRLDFEEGGADPLAMVKDAVLAAAGGSRGWLAYLLTPAVAGEEIQVAGRRPVAAAIGRPLRVSGWSARDGAPRGFLTLLPAGSEFFFDWEPALDEEGRRRWIAEQWLAPLEAEYGASGFGRLLIGVWG